MRAIYSKLMTGAAVAGAALLVTACGGTETVNNSNTVVTDMNDTGMMDGTTSDNMTTGVDGAMGNDAMMSNDMMGGNMSNDTMMSNDMGGNMSGNMSNGM